MEDMDTGACRQRTDQIIQRTVKRKAVEMSIVLAMADGEPVCSPSREMPQRAVTLHHALGSPGGTGGIDHIGVSLGTCQVYRLRAGTALHNLCEGRLRQNKPGSAVLQHIPDSALRITAVNGHISHARLHHAKNSGGEFLHPPHPDSRKHILRSLFGKKPDRDGIRQPVQFLISEGTAAVRDRRRLRMRQGSLQKQIHKRFSIFKTAGFSRRKAADFLCLLFREHRNPGGGRLRIAHHLIKHVPDGAAECSQGPLTVQFLTGSDADLVITVIPVDGDGDIAHALLRLNLPDGTLFLTKIKIFPCMICRDEIKADPRNRMQLFTEIGERIAVMTDCHHLLQDTRTDHFHYRRIPVKLCQRGDRLHKHAVAVLQPPVMPSADHHGIGRFFSGHEGDQDPGKGCLKESVDGQIVFSAKGIDLSAGNERRRPQQLPHRIPLSFRQSGQRQPLKTVQEISPVPLIGIGLRVSVLLQGIFKHTVSRGRKRALVCFFHIPFGEEFYGRYAIHQDMMIVDQKVILLLSLYDLSPEQRLLSEKIKRSDKFMLCVGDCF